MDAATQLQQYSAGLAAVLEDLAAAALVRAPLVEEPADTNARAVVNRASGPPAMEAAGCSTSAYGGAASDLRQHLRSAPAPEAAPNGPR